MKFFEVGDRPAGRAQSERLIATIEVLGGDAKSFHRERARQAKAIIVEIYSPPRVTVAEGRLPRCRLQLYLILDIAVDDDMGQQPVLRIGSPMCTACSAIQAINNIPGICEPAGVARAQVARRLYLHWCCQMCPKQVARGAYFLHEHPNGATSWVEPCVLADLSLISVQRVRADQCILGQESEAGSTIRTPTGLMANSPHLVEALNKRWFGKNGLCSRPGGGAYQACLGKVARQAAIFSDAMCENIMVGFSAQLKADRRMRENEPSDT